MKIEMRKFIKNRIIPDAKRITSILLLGFLIAGCMKSQTEKRIGDGGFISEKPCSVPCFFGIIPG
jgi:hypothetical protein